jgi:hypothetical protein
LPVWEDFQCLDLPWVPLDAEQLEAPGGELTRDGANGAQAFAVGETFADEES